MYMIMTSQLTVKEITGCKTLENIYWGCDRTVDFVERLEHLGVEDKVTEPIQK